MRICFDGHGLGGNLTGAGKALTCLLRQLRLDFPQHEYIVLVSNGARRRLPGQLFWEQVQFPWQALCRGADLLHVPGGTSAPLLPHRRVVMTIHDIAPTRRPEFLPHFRSRWYWGRWIPFTARLADALIVPSHATKRDLVELVGIAEDRIHVVPWGVPLDPGHGVAPAAAEKVKRTYHLPEPYLLYVGTIDRRKDYATLLQALRELDPRISLVLAGTLIAGRTDFHKVVERLGLDARVRFLGYVPEEDLAGLYGAAAAFVYPSFYEGFGLPVLEAMACGTPVICYNATALPEVVGEAGVLVDPPWTPEALAGQLSRVLEDEALQLELRQKGFEQAKRFDWAETARLTAQVYEAVGGSG